MTDPSYITPPSRRHFNAPQIYRRLGTPLEPSSTHIRNLDMSFQIPVMAITEIINPAVLRLYNQVLNSHGTVSSTIQLMRIDATDDSKESEIKEDDEMSDTSSADYQVGNESENNESENNDNESVNNDNNNENDSDKENRQPNKRQKTITGMRVIIRQEVKNSVSAIIREIQLAMSTKVPLIDCSHISNAMLTDLLSIGCLTFDQLKIVLPDSKWYDLLLHQITTIPNILHPPASEIVQLIAYYRAQELILSTNNIIISISNYVKINLHRLGMAINEIEHGIADLYRDLHKANMCTEIALITIPSFHPTAFVELRANLIQNGMIDNANSMHLSSRQHDPQLYDAIILHGQASLTSINQVLHEELIVKLEISTLEKIFANSDMLNYKNSELLVKVAINRKMNSIVINTLINKYITTEDYPVLLLTALIAGRLDEKYVISQLLQVKKPIFDIDMHDKFHEILCLAPATVSCDFMRSLLQIIKSIPPFIIYDVHVAHPGLLDEPSILPLLSLGALQHYTFIREIPDEHSHARAWAMFFQTNENYLPLYNVANATSLVDTWNGCSAHREAMCKNIHILAAILGDNDKLNAIYLQLDEKAQVFVILNCIKLISLPNQKRFLDNLKLFIRDNMYTNSLPISTVLKLRTAEPSVFKLTNEESLQLLVVCIKGSKQFINDVPLFNKLEKWEQAILSEVLNGIGFLPYVTRQRYRLEWISDPSWNQFKCILLKLNNNRMVIENGNGVDMGGPRKEFYSKLSPKLRHLFVELDGYLMPRSNLDKDDINALRILLQRVVYIDYSIMSQINNNNIILHVQCTRPEIDLHPALLLLMTFPTLVTSKSPWKLIAWYMGSWLGTLFPRSSFEKSLSCIYSELSEKYSNYYSVMLEISNEFALLPISPRELQARLVGKLVTREILIDVVKIVGIPGADIYLAAFKVALGSLPDDIIPELMRFWFATDRPNFTEQHPLLQFIVCDPNNRNIVSHSCAGQLDIPKLSTGESNKEEIVQDITNLIMAALENQRRAESINWLYQRL